MKSIIDFPLEKRTDIAYVLTDIDDTITNNGRIPACAFQAMENLEAANIRVVPVTGRPAGWCDHIARMWPVSGVVGENGAFYFVYDPHKKKMIRRYARTDQQRTQDTIKLKTIQEKILAQVPGSVVSADQPFRQADLAIDFAEDVPPLARTDIDRIVAIFEQFGATAKISSIHVNGWFGTYDKLSMTRLLFEEIFKTSLDRIKETVVFVGDSPNDAPMFDYFPHAIGVANVRDCADRLVSKPAWITPSKGGFGFAEIAALLVS